MKNERVPFSPSGDFVVRRELRFAGRSFRPGEKFPWRRLACSPRRLRQLYDGGYLNTLDSVVAATGDMVVPATGGGGTNESLVTQEGTPDETVDGETDEFEEVDEPGEEPKKKKKKKKKVGDSK